MGAKQPIQPFRRICPLRLQKRKSAGRAWRSEEGRQRSIGYGGWYDSAPQLRQTLGVAAGGGDSRGAIVVRQRHLWAGVP